MSGRGTFRWPSGLRYTGEYVDNKRQGYGEQEWPEGSRYEGSSGRTSGRGGAGTPGTVERLVHEYIAVQVSL